jgi:tryptophanase
MREVASVCREFGKPLYLDACRIAENAYFIKTRESECAGMSVREIVKEMCSLADGCTMSAKKDAIVNMGGFLATRDPDVKREAHSLLILTEGFPTYGGLSGRDLEALAIGLQEGIDEDYLNYRIASTRYIGNHLREAGVPLIWPTGGHAIYLDAKRIAPHLTPTQLPGVSFAIAMYELGGVRACEIGTLMFGRQDPVTGEETDGPRELVRMAIPRRVYTQSHMDYVIEAVIHVHEHRKSLGGYRIVEEPKALRHFTCAFAPL